jgi:hypothetical protein
VAAPKGAQAGAQAKKMRQRPVNSRTEEEVTNSPSAKAERRTMAKSPTKAVTTMNCGPPRAGDVGTRAPRSAALSKMLRSYKGVDDFHLPLFEATWGFTNACKVLYPGCHRHIGASLVFPEVDYVDCDKRVMDVYKDAAALEWVRKNKRYDSEPKISFLAADFTQKLGIPDGSFDLMVSACAGIVTATCGRYIRLGGHLLVSDAHFDARTVFLDKRFQLLAVYDMEERVLKSAPGDLAGHFMTKAGPPICAKQVEMSIALPKSRRRFKLVKEAMFYLFKRVA